MKEVPLTNGGVTLVDDEDYEWVIQHEWQCNKREKNGLVRVGGVSRCGRAAGKSVTYYLHRVILNAPTGVKVDHIDRNPLNNQHYNLRLASSYQNSHNMSQHRDAWTKYKGVYRCGWAALKKPWRARIMSHGKPIHLGYYATEEAAAEAYNKTATELFGEYVCLNEIELVDTPSKKGE